MPRWLISSAQYARDGLKRFQLVEPVPAGLSGNIDPRDYLKRLEDWKVRVEASGGRWQMINGLEPLDPAFLR